MTEHGGTTSFCNHGKASGEPVFTTYLDDDSGCVTFFIDGEEAGDWWCGGEQEDSLFEFKRVFMLGMNYKST